MRALLLIILLTGVSSLPTDVKNAAESKIDNLSRNNELEQLVLGLLETLRQLMITGSGDIPILDPLQLKYIQLDEDFLNIPGSHLTLNSLTVNHASTFIVDRLSISLTNVILQRYTCNFEGHIPALEVEVDGYDVLLHIMGVDIFGRGDGKLAVIEPRITGTLVFGPRISITGISFAVSNTVIKFSLTGFEPELTGLFNHDGASEFVSSFLKTLVPELVTFYEDDITEFLSEIVQDLLNDILADLDIGDLLPQFFDMPRLLKNNIIKE